MKKKKRITTYNFIFGRSFIVVIEEGQYSHEGIGLRFHIVIQKQDKFSLHLFVEDDIVVVSCFVMMVIGLNSRS